MDSAPNPVARAWAAAAAAGEWAAAAHRRSGWAEYGRAHGANADALKLAGRAVATYAFGMAHNRIDEKVAGRAMDAMKEVAAECKGSAAAFGGSARLWRGEAAALESAAEAYERIGWFDHERAARMRTIAALQSALASAKWEATISTEAGAFERESAEWAANAAEWAGGHKVPKGRQAEWTGECDSERANIEDDREAAAAAAEEAAEAERDSTAAMERAREAAELAAQFIADARAIPGAHDAVSAWYEAMAAAMQAAAAAAAAAGETRE